MRRSGFWVRKPARSLVKTRKVKRDGRQSILQLCLKLKSRKVLYRSPLRRPQRGRAPRPERLRFPGKVNVKVEVKRFDARFLGEFRVAPPISPVRHSLCGAIPSSEAVPPETPRRAVQPLPCSTARRGASPWPTKSGRRWRKPLPRAARSYPGPTASNEH